MVKYLRGDVDDSSLYGGAVPNAAGILLINRAKPPYRGRWNGLGGKVEPGESRRPGRCARCKKKAAR
ncbi:NUDIX domain-containing protein [Lacticaseibacillus nasuensis]|uniref:NUDIX domain-containing protein n=1 Tax=Lacticaseibacillus nasuensis TaxID=944671 RepID=UPI0034E1B114